MTSDPLFYVVATACLLVAAILLFGVAVFTKGGEFNRKYANRIMRLRVIAQLVAVLLILLFVWLRVGG